ncbi:MAG: DUF4397 domain-containing protein [Acidobacteriota bacterium]
MRKLLTSSLLALALFFAPAAVFAAEITVIHGISGSAIGLDADLPVDIYANGALLLAGVTFTQSATLEVPADTYDISVFLAGSDPNTDAPVLTLSATLAENDDVDIVAHLTPGPGIALTPFFNNTVPQITGAISPRISERQTRLTVRHGADFPRAAINRLVTAFELSFVNGQEFVLDLDPGDYRFWLSRLGGLRPLSFDPVSVSLAADTHYYAYAVGSWRDGSFQLLLLAEDFE